LGNVNDHLVISFLPGFLEASPDSLKTKGLQTLLLEFQVHEGRDVLDFGELFIGFFQCFEVPGASALAYLGITVALTAVALPMP
jgi:hypothetical protein